MVEKDCEICGKHFKSYKKNPRFCSMECKLIDRENNRVYKSCDYCHETFFMPKSVYEISIKRNQQRFFCCKECRIESEKHNIDDIRKEFEEKGYELISDCYESAKTYLKYYCNIHKDKGVLKITYDNFKTGYGCKYCGRDKIGKAKRNDMEKVKNVFLSHDLILVEGQEYHNSQQKLKYICKHHPEKGIQEMSYGNALDCHCPFCRCSRGEKEISNYLDSNNIKYESQKKFSGLIGIGGGLLSYDFYLPDFNMLIEYQGEQHYFPFNFKDRKDRDSETAIHNYEKQVKHDILKKEYAINNNFNFLEIPYTEYKNISKILNENINTKILRDCGAVMVT